MDTRTQSNNKFVSNYETESNAKKVLQIDPAQRFMHHFFPNLPKSQLKKI